jgi:hypothetical protein
VNKRIVALGVSAAMALGAGVAVADTGQDLSTNQANLAGQESTQVANVWQKTWQDHPNAQAGASADATSLNSAGGNSKWSALSGNGVVFSNTQAGFAGASAKNLNIGKQDVDQDADQDIDQDNEANGGTKVAVDDVSIKVFIGAILADD